MPQNRFFREQVRLNPYVTLFLRPRSTRWQIVIQMPGQKRVMRSTGQSNLDLAKIAAEKAYLEIRGRLHHNLTLDGKSLAEVMPLYLADLDLRLEIGEIGPDTRENYALVVQRDFVTWAAERAAAKRIDEFTDQDLLAFRTWRQARRLRTLLRPSSMNIMLTAVSDLFNFAVRSGWITKRQKPLIPWMPVPKQKIERSDFTVEEYVRLRRMSRQRIADATKRHRIQRQTLDLVIQIMIGSGIRTAEMMNIRWIDLKAVREAHTRVSGLIVRTAELSIPGNEVKPGREIILKPYVFHYLKKLRALTGRSDRETLMPYRDLEGSFTRLLIASDLKIDRRGNRRILYSLRHTYAIWAATHPMRKKIPTLSIAKAMGHELDVHGRVYARVLSTDASRAIALG